MRYGWLLFLLALAAAVAARAQQKTGPGITGDDSLTWHGITLYGVIDVGVQYDTVTHFQGGIALHGDCIWLLRMGIDWGEQEQQDKEIFSAGAHLHRL